MNINNNIYHNSINEYFNKLIYEYFNIYEIVFWLVVYFYVSYSVDVYMCVQHKIKSIFFNKF